MSEDKTAGFFTLNSPAILFFETLFEPKPFIGKNGKPQGEPKYSSTLMFNADHPDLAGMKELAAKIARQKWPDKPFSELAFPFTSGDKQAEKRKAKGKDDSDTTRGKVLIKNSSKFPPQLVVLAEGKMIELDSDVLRALHKKKFYRGVEALAQLNFVAYDPIGDNAKGGVTTYLNMILSTGKGTRLSGGATASEVFKGYVGTISAEDPTGGNNLNDEIPF